MELKFRPQIAGILLLWLGLLLGAARVGAAEFRDRPEDREVIDEPRPLPIQGSNISATFDAEEPNHRSKIGGHSMWLSWVAPSTGIVSFRTANSSFDTILAAYTLDPEQLGKTFYQRLRPVVSDDDVLDGYESGISFATLKGQVYEIAIDGYAGTTGSFSFRISPRAYEDLKPIQTILSQDKAMTVGGTVELRQQLSSGFLTNFQWYFNGNPILGATNGSLLIEQFHQTNVGKYWFTLKDLDTTNNAYMSETIDLQINTEGDAEVLAQDKMLDFATISSRAAAPFAGGARQRAGLQDGFSRGYKGTQIFDTTYGRRDPDEPRHCGVAGGASYWFPYVAPASGVLKLDTFGSGFDTVLAVYTFPRPLTGYKDLAEAGCNNNASAEAKESQLTLPVEEGREYLIVVDGVGGAKGSVVLNYELVDQLEAPITIDNPPKPQTVTPGRPMKLAVYASGLGPLFYQWFKDSKPLLGATNRIYSREVTRPSDSGLYSVEIKGPVSATTTDPVPVSFLVSVGFVPDRATGRLKLTTPAKAGVSYALEASTNLNATGWKSVTNGVADSDVISVTAPSGNESTGFFRFRLW